MEHGYSAEPLAANRSIDLGREADLGTSTIASAPALRPVLDRCQIHLGFSAAGDSVDQERSEATRCDGGFECARSPRLAQPSGPVAASRSVPATAPESSSGGDDSRGRRPGESDRQPSPHGPHQATATQDMNQARRAFRPPADVRNRQQIATEENLHHGGLLGSERRVDLAGQDSPRRFSGTDKNVAIRVPARFLTPAGTAASSA